MILWCKVKSVVPNYTERKMKKKNQEKLLTYKGVRLSPPPLRTSQSLKNSLIALKVENLAPCSALCVLCSPHLKLSEYHCQSCLVFCKVQALVLIFSFLGFSDLPLALWELGFAGCWGIFAWKIEEHATGCGEEEERRGRA